MIAQFFNKDVLNSNDKIDNLIKKYNYIDKVDNEIYTQENNYNILVNEINNININNYIKKYENKTILEILQEELKIIKLLSKYALQSNELNYDFVIKCVNICFNISEILRKKLNQDEINFLKNNLNIQRCSYKFCNFKDNCNYNYNTKNNRYCYQDHYVHNMVSHDLKILINYIESEKFKNINKNEKLKEILKSINTLSYVINHMENELNSKCLYQDKDKWDTFHIINYYKK
jgi:hypothetical protein